jgi:glycosyltransferase involved in cell wall biosynthesis
MNNRIFYVVNSDWFFLSHRLQMALEAKKRGYDVFILTKNTGKKVIIESYGLKFIEMQFDRSGTNPFKDLFIILDLIKVYKKLKPGIIHHVTIKPALYGTIAAKFIPKGGVKVVNAISGLGYNFINNRESLTQRIVKWLMFYAFNNRKANFIFQNPDDLALYDKLGFLDTSNHILIKGAGVDANIYKYRVPVPKDKIRIILPARMLYDKGIIEFIAAAKLLEPKLRGKVEFRLLGGIDNGNPSAISINEIKKMEVENYLVWYGHTENIMEEHYNADIVCLPSYREGLPKALVEGMAVGRPIVTTNVAGCKECVDEGINGFLVPNKDSVKLAVAILRLCENEPLRLEMGLASRAKMERELSLDYVLSSTFSFYENSKTLL